jgi:hypothetical protein
MPGYIDATTLVRQLQGRLEEQSAELASLEAGQLDVRTAHLRGNVGPLVVPAATLVRIPLPAIVAANTHPGNGAGARNSDGVLVYADSEAGGYEAHCSISFGTNTAADVIYRFYIAEGTSLAGITAIGDPLVRDLEFSAIEKRLTAGDSTTVPSGHMFLRSGGGQVAAFVEHNSASSITLDVTYLSLFLQRSTQG